jgi:hypothetical protein
MNTRERIIRSINVRSTHSAPVLHSFTTDPALAVVGNKPTSGKGIKQDDFKALKFFQKACDLNDGNGCFNLGLLFGPSGTGKSAWLIEFLFSMMAIHHPKHVFIILRQGVFFWF